MTRRDFLPATAICFAVALGFLACGRTTESSSFRYQVRLALPGSPSAAQGGFPGPYASVLDTAILTVTSASNAISSDRVRLGQRDSVATFNVTAEAGVARFEARVVSNNGTLLFDTTQSVNIGPGNDTIRITVRPRNPVLLVSLNFTLVDNGQQRVFSTRVHNRGLGTLNWGILDTLPPACRPPGPYCVFNVKGAETLAAQTFRTLTITRPTAAPLPAVVLTSQVGAVSFP